MSVELTDLVEDLSKLKPDELRIISRLASAMAVTGDLSANLKKRLKGGINDLGQLAEDYESDLIKLIKSVSRTPTLADQYAQRKKTVLEAIYRRYRGRPKSERENLTVHDFMQIEAVRVATGGNTGTLSNFLKRNPNISYDTDARRYSITQYPKS